MTLLELPWVEIAVALPLVGAVVVALLRDPATAARWTLGISVAVLGCSVMPWVALSAGVPGNDWFAVDGLTAPLLPLLALLHVLTVLATPRVARNRMSLGGLLIGESLRLGTFAAAPGAPWLLIFFLVVAVVPPAVELRHRGKPMRVYTIHMALFVALLVAGWAAIEWQIDGVGTVLLMLALLVRGGTVPAHLWVADLFEHATFDTALLYVIPLVGMYAAIRLVLPIATDWVLNSIGIVSLVMAVYAAGMAVVQDDARRFFAYFFLSHASVVRVGLELDTALSLTGALCQWVSVVISLGGMGLTMRAIEARHGRLSLAGFRGLYDQSPALGVCFLVTGLGSVGFPGTLGFVATELLIDGAIRANLVIGVGLVLAAAMNGIAVLRAYTRLFTGVRQSSALPLGITARERFAVLTLTAMILVGGLYPQPGIADRHAVVRSLPGAGAVRHEAIAPAEVRTAPG